MIEFKVRLFMELSQDRCDGKRQVLEQVIPAWSMGEALHKLVSGFSNELGKTTEGDPIFWVDTTGKPEPVNRASYAIVKEL